MKEFKISISIITLFCFIFINFANCLACDVTHNFNEEYNLYYDDSFEGPCQGSKYENASCVKYLIRYDGLASKIEEIKKFISEEDPMPRTRTLEKVGIVTTIAAPIGIGLCFAPITTILITLGLGVSASAFCLAHNNVIKPVDEVVGTVPRMIEKVKNFFTGKKSVPNPDIGVIGNVITVMCGDNSQEGSKDDGLLERIRKLVFGEKASNIKKTNEQIAYKELLDEFYKQVKKRKFEKNDNNILVFCMDSTDANSIKHKLKFDRTDLYTGDYPNKTEDYFKDWL